MTGERDLQKLLRELKPQLNPGEYVFCVLEPGVEVRDAETVGWFREHEGVTVILPRLRSALLRAAPEPRR